MELALACPGEAFGDADRKMLDNDLLWPTLGRTLLGGVAWCEDQPATVTKGYSSLTVCEGPHQKLAGP